MPSPVSCLFFSLLLCHLALVVFFEAGKIHPSDGGGDKYFISLWCSDTGESLCSDLEYIDTHTHT